MNVLACDRAGCENIMCGRVSNRYGYICWKCLDELVASGTLDIQAFMEEEKSCEEKPDREFYEKIFSNRAD